MDSLGNELNELIEANVAPKVARRIGTEEARVASAHKQVLDMVAAANANALPARQVTPRAALTVFERAYGDLSSLSDESRTAGAIREVSRFLSVNQVTSKAYDSSYAHTDLLVFGHPLAPETVLSSNDEIRRLSAEWIAADPAVADSARALVATAHSQAAGTIAREHAFIRLRALTAGAVPAHIMIDSLGVMALVAAGGNSSAARRARVALQLRDRKGRWVEMGRGLDFRFRMPDGSIATGHGTYIGAAGDTEMTTSSSGKKELTATAAQVYVDNVPGLPRGIYTVNADNIESYKARIPGRKAPTPNTFEGQLDKSIPDVADLQATKADAPIGWKSARNGMSWVSDDGYEVILGQDKQPFSVRRTIWESPEASRNAETNRVRSWADVQDFISKDEPAYDAEVARIEGANPEPQLPVATLPDGAGDALNPSEIKDMLRSRQAENDAFDAAQGKPEEIPANQDLNGNPVPDNWTRDANDPTDTNYTRELPRRDGGTYPIIARQMPDGRYIAGDRSGWIPEDGSEGRSTRYFDSLEEVNTAVPDFIDYLNSTFTKDNPIAIEKPVTKDYSMETIPYDTTTWDEAAQKAIKSSGEAQIIDYAGRKIIVLDINGEKIPFYLSSGQGGKKNVEAGKWYPFFGIGEDGWINKLSAEEINSYYDSPELKAAAEWLDANVGDVRDDKSIPKVGASGQHLDFINQGLNPAENQKPDTPELVNKNIADVKARVSVEKPSTEPVTYGKSKPKNPADIKPGDQVYHKGEWKTVKSVDGKGLNRRLDFEDGSYKVVGIRVEPQVKSPETPREMPRFGEGIDTMNPDGSAKTPVSLATPDNSTPTPDDILKSLQGHMDESGTTESAAMGIGNVQDDVKAGKKALEAGNKELAVSYFEDAYNALDNGYGDEGSFESSQAGAEAMDQLDKLIESLNAEQANVKPAMPDTSGDLTEISPDNVKNLQKKMNAEDSSILSVNGLTFFNDMVGPSEYSDEITITTDSWEPGDGIIAKIMPDGGIDWESDAMYDTWSDSLRRALDSMGLGEGEANVKPAMPEEFNYDNAQKIALDETKSGQERYAALLDGAQGEKLSEFIDRNGPDPDELDPSIPLDAEVVIADGDGQNLTVRYPDGSYHYIDTGAFDPKTDLIPVQNVNEFDGEVNNEIFNDIFDPNAVAFYRGGLIDPARERAIYQGNSKKFTANQLDAANADPDLEPKGPDGNAFSYQGGVMVWSKDSRAWMVRNGARDMNLGRAATVEDAKRMIDKSNGRGPDEPPSGPGGGGTPPKAPRPSAPSTPGLFEDFNVPDGAFQLRTVDYEPEGRIDEKSSNFTDDPRALANRFPLENLVSALSEALIGSNDESIIDDVMDANFDDNGDIADFESVSDVLDERTPRANVGQPSGAGRLEFNAGEEFVPAEALYNAIWHAGGDPNRVIANIYDAANGNRDNLNRLVNAQGGVPSKEEAALIDDITEQISQIKKAAPDEEKSPANKSEKPEEKLQPLIDNVPVYFSDPVLYTLDTNPYDPGIPTPDENGFTDNPELLARYFYTADLIDQLTEAITDGSGFGTFDFGSPDGETRMVQVEAIRDALQHQGVNTNEILINIEKSNGADENKPDAETQKVQAHSQMIKDVIEQSGNTVDVETADKIRDAINEKGLLDWSEADDAELIDAITEVAGARLFGQESTPEKPAASSNDFTPFSDLIDEYPGDANVPNERVIKALDKVSNDIADKSTEGLDNVRFIAFDSNTGDIAVDTPAGIQIYTENNGVFNVGENRDAQWFATEGANRGWEPVPGEVADAIRARNAEKYPNASTEEPSAPAPEAPTPEPAAPETPPAPTYPYPGPRERGYTANNTTMDYRGNVIGAGARVKALRDNQFGTVVSIQNDPEYVRIKLDNGKTVVRSANQIYLANPADAGAPPAPPARPVREDLGPVTDVTERLSGPRPNPVIARDGRTPGVNDRNANVPDEYKDLVLDEDAVQSDFSEWGTRDAEIAKAARERIAMDELHDQVYKWLEIDRDPTATASEKKQAYEKAQAMFRDAFGQRDGLSFGAEFFTLDLRGVSIGATYGNGPATLEQIQKRERAYSVTISGRILDKDGREVGSVERNMIVTPSKDVDGNITYDVVPENKILRVNSTNKKLGFASAYNRYMENWYIANGVKQVKVHAYSNGSPDWQGGFVWALNGFGWDPKNMGYATNALDVIGRSAETDEEREIVKKLKKRFSDSYDPATQTYDLSKAPTPMELALAGWYPGAKTWAGRKGLLKTHWYGIKNLNPTAIEQKQAANYRALKAAEVRAKAGQNKPQPSQQFLSLLNSDEFQSDPIAQATLGSHMDSVRDVLKNNRSLAILSPDAKAALSNYVSKNLYDPSSKVPLDDLMRVRTGLMAEYRADFAVPDAFAGAGYKLTGYDRSAFRDAARGDGGSMLEQEGFDVEEFGDGGINPTYLVTHRDSGQTFFVKSEEHRDSWGLQGRGLTPEVEASYLFNTLGMIGAYQTRASTEDPDLIIMSTAGADLPLVRTPMQADTANVHGLYLNDGTKVNLFNSDAFAEGIKNPEDIYRMLIADTLLGNEDRHGGNWLLAIDRTDNKAVIFPIDHTLADMPVDNDQALDAMNDYIARINGMDYIYERFLPKIIKKMGRDRALQVFKNEVKRSLDNLDNELYQPREQELAAIIEKWGSYDAFKDAMRKRLNDMIDPNSRLGATVMRVFANIQ